MFTNKNNVTWCRCFSFKALCLSLQEPLYTWVPAGVVFDARFSSNRHFSTKFSYIKNCFAL